MKPVSIERWIQHRLESDPPRSKSVVMTVFGDSITPRGGAVWLGSLMKLLQTFGISDRLVRTSVFRLAEEGWLEAERQGRRSLYRATASGARRFERAHRRIYFPAHEAWDGRWTLLMASGDQLSAGQRASLRKELTWEGFGNLAPGSFIHPQADHAALEEILERSKATQRVLVCMAQDAQGLSARPLAELVQQCWDLNQVQQGYRSFIEAFAPLLALLRKLGCLDAEHAFVIRTLLIHAFRRVQLHDPRLPQDLLPTDWPGQPAYGLCSEIYRITMVPAERHVSMALREEDEQPREANEEFFRRFGGLEAA